MEFFRVLSHVSLEFIVGDLYQTLLDSSNYEPYWSIIKPSLIYRVRQKYLPVFKGK
jgi:hypothetical protein